MAVAAMQSTGILYLLAETMMTWTTNESILSCTIGLLSSIVDNVPLIAATQGMFDMDKYPSDHYLWQFLAYATGTGGSSLIIGSSSGIVAMGLEKISFVWYLKKITILALAGFFAGACVFMLIN
jgi:Na+/H+ antiporter NhaD/arsenite permease-like protein